MEKLNIHIFLLLFITTGCIDSKNNKELPSLKVSENKRFLVTEDNNPFFWLLTPDGFSFLTHSRRS
jgi:hypothetical protein